MSSEHEPQRSSVGDGTAVGVSAGTAATGKVGICEGVAGNVGMGVALGARPGVDAAGSAAGVLLGEIGSPRLKVVMDGANVFPAGDLPRMREILEEAFALLGNDIVLAHAKDLSQDGEAGHEAAGTGLLDYDLYLSLLRRVGYRGPLILHALAEE